MIILKEIYNINCDVCTYDYLSELNDDYDNFPIYVISVNLTIKYHDLNLRYIKQFLPQYVYTKMVRKGLDDKKYVRILGINSIRRSTSHDLELE